MGIAQQHVGLAGTRKIAEARGLPVEPDAAQEGGVGDVVSNPPVLLLRNSKSVVSLPKKPPSVK
jgi:hypothetical protein